MPTKEEVVIAMRVEAGLILVEEAQLAAGWRRHRAERYGKNEQIKPA